MSPKYLYLLLYPNNSLIASQYEPARFAQHYAQGSTGFYGGNFLFIEVDPDFRHPYFKIDAAYTHLKPHEDGRLKATKFICDYRTLEHMDFNAFRNLYYCNAHGNFIELCSGDAQSSPSTLTEPQTPNNELSIYLDLCPTKIVVLSRHTFEEYGAFSIDPNSFVSTPSILYTQVEFDMDEFLVQFEQNPFLPLTIPNIHPARLRDSIREVITSPTKRNKGIAMDCPFDKVSYRSLMRGFMFKSQTQSKFYPLIPMNIVEKEFYQFWKAM